MFFGGGNKTKKNDWGSGGWHKKKKTYSRGRMRSVRIW